MRMNETSNCSKVFEAFKALGLHSSNLPHATRYHKRHQENYVFTAVGKVFHTYNCSKLGLCQVSNRHDSDINCIAADSYLVYTSCDNVVNAYQHNRYVVHSYKGHSHPVHLILPFGKHLVTVDATSNVRVWHIKTGDEFLSLQFSNLTFEISALLHPSTYVNKVLFGSRQGKLQLWNINRSRLVYEFSDVTNSNVTVLEQAPALDVVAIGHESGEIVLLNLRMDSVVMKFHQEYGSVTAISFRTDGETIMATGTQIGHICLWDLKEKKLSDLIENAHASPVAGITFLPNQPLLFSNASDNSLKTWAFDNSGRNGNLLRERSGHFSSQTKIRFYKDSSIVSAGNDSTVRLFSCIHPRKDKNLGQASLNRKKARKQAIRFDDGKMPPVVDFSIETVREGQWDGVIAAHYRHPLATTWNIQNGRMGAHKFGLENLKVTKSDNRAGFQHNYVSSVASTSCGNFCVIGYNTGNIDMFNIQSGISRGSYIDPSLPKKQGKKRTQAHLSAVKGVSVDALNQITVSVGSEAVIKFWKFKEKSLRKSIKLEAVPSFMNLHRGSGMLAVAGDDFSITIMDIETRTIVRRFSGHSGKLNDLTWSDDGRWVVSTGADCTIRTWDVPSASLVDCFMVDNAVTSLALSPASDLLATTHIDDVGIYLWSNKTLYSHIHLNALSHDYHPDEAIDLPTSIATTMLDEEDDIGTDEEESEPTTGKELIQPLEVDLITLSNLSYSRWANVLKLDRIRQRNKPKEPPKAPKNAPFFLPTVASLNPSFLVETESETTSSKFRQTNPVEQFSDIALKLLNAEGNYETVLSSFKNMTLSAVDTEIRCLSPDNGGSIELLEAFLDFVEYYVAIKFDFEVIQAYFSLFLTVHAESLSKIETIERRLSEISSKLNRDRLELSNLLNQSLCIVSFVKSATL